MVDFTTAKDVNGNLWPNWMVEEATPGPTRKLINVFNKVFHRRPSLLYPDEENLGVPLSEHTKYYIIHNQEYYLEFSDLVHTCSRRCTNEYCEISLAYTQKNGYPALTGQGYGRVCQVIAPKHDEPGEVAIYRLEVPRALSLAAFVYDTYDKLARFKEWDPDTPLRSPVPSRGRILRSIGKGTGSSGGWGHTSTTAGGEGRLTLTQLVKKYY